MPYLDRDGDVFVLHLGNKDETDNENRFHPDWILAVHALLDEVESHEGPAALVTTATGKFYTNGLDTTWVFSNVDKLPSYLDSVHTIYSRLLAFPMTTVAAVQGHAFGAGAMLASAHDFRVMRGDRGFYCLPEVTLNMPFTVGMSALVTGRLPKQTAVEAMVTGRRYGGGDALAAGIVDETADGDGVLAAAVARAAAATSTRGPNLAGIKRGIHGDTLEALATATDEANFRFG
ncbi:enoyl-CoA hydratase/isomerase family protein [Rhodococcus triatomae]|uniref:Enoyl-CoA hydratase/carnithine racemase n=1 Tax=Rhodococcus triatomae TaxID=300028 RepID=A0A1G8FHU9_9NOCA|nr:enoyl-CoA hydratase/isomerase family protein [Rhodococcus triatomae]QNG19486.1 enoyl-CoA hydratase/isomerase family protein [Rhodococcus triatomae]QNG24599.1 enoyl-CoA hydratase/isomerase family protein [Rhodococcus triatomae]SDH81626.1 Enoyl-CoA hydratase/carnithine racemase [Rhodococcus triatomae]